MTKEEKIICKDFLNDADKTHSCNEYKLLMALLEQEDITWIVGNDNVQIAVRNMPIDMMQKINAIIGNKQEPTIKNETLVSLGVYKQVAWERDIAIQQLHELGYEFGQKIEPTTKSDVPDINVGKIGSTTKNNLAVDCISRKAVQTRLKEIINEMETIFADIREREVNDLVCGLCEYDCDHGLDGFANECPGFEKDDCFKLNEKYKAEWLDISNLPPVTPQEPIFDKIREQIKSHLRGVEITLEVLVENDPLRPKMEGAKDTLEECLEIINKAESEPQESEG